MIGPIDLAERVDDALAVQALAFGLTDDEVAIRRQIVLQHSRCPGVRAFGAALGPDPASSRLVGFGYGMPNDRTHWWSGIIEPYLRRVGRDDWLDDAFAVTELHVLPAYQGRGLGRSLITRLTDGVAQPRSILSAVDEPSRARNLYHSLGYLDLVRCVRFPGSYVPYAVMGAPLPLPGPRPAILAAN